MRGTVPAIEAREEQQLNVVKELIDAVFRAELERVDSGLFRTDVAQLLLTCLAAELRGIPWTLDPDETHSEAEIPVEATLLPRAQHFARTDNERGLILTKLLDGLLRGTVGQFQSRWQAETRRDPVTTLKAKSRMDLVPIIP